MDETTNAQLIGQIEGLQLALAMLRARPTAHAFSVAAEVEQALDGLRGDLLDAGVMRRPSSVATAVR